MVILKITLYLLSYKKGFALSINHIFIYLQEIFKKVNFNIANVIRARNYINVV